MTWLPNPHIHNTFVSLGTHCGDIYIVNKNFLESLEDIFKNLITEDHTLRTYRRAIGFGENIRKDLIPLLINVKNSTTIATAEKIIDITVKILLNLTIPVECLLSLKDESKTDEVRRHTMFELNHLLKTGKEAFTDSRSTKAIIEHIKYVIEKNAILNGEQCDSINNCILLLRNILHIPENKANIASCPLAHVNMQNQIIWNLFTQSIDKIMIHLMTCPQKMYWAVTIVQFIALMYKDQYAGTLQKLLSLWFESSLSDSSEDNESNTSPQNQDSENSSPIVTSDLTSDSSDNGGSGHGKIVERSKNYFNKSNKSSTDEALNGNVTTINRGKSVGTSNASSNSVGSQTSTDSGIYNKETLSKTSRKHSCTSAQSELSDRGYSTQIENRGSISTSSNDDEQPHQKPIHQKLFQKSRYNNLKSRATTASEKKELRRKKLVKRIKTNIINMKGLMHYTPTDEDITNVLKEFTVDFLLKTYGTLVRDLYSQLLTNVHFSIDTSHFFWLITYFLKFATQLELDLELINSVLSYDIISYLIFQGVWLYEELEIGFRERETDLTPSLRRLHLVVTAIREFFQAIETYEKISHLSTKDRNSIVTLQEQISEIEQLKNFLLLLLRQYNPKFQSKQYLQDLIVTNHCYLLLLDKFSKNKNSKLNFIEHLKEFAAVDIMHQYGILLEEFEKVGEYVNNCIFTMMHHIAGDLDNIAALFQPNILKVFSQIWETGYEISDDWSDLIEYVIHSFINVSKSSQQFYACSSISCHTNREVSVSSQPSAENMSTYEDRNWHVTSTIDQDIEKQIRQIINYEDPINTNKNIILNDILRKNIEKSEHTHCIKLNENNRYDADYDQLLSSSDYENLIIKDETALKNHLIKHGKEKSILWLQNSLIEACFAKMMIENIGSHTCKKEKVQPIAYYYTLLNLPIPLIPWTSEQHSIIKHQPFILLLHKLGFILPQDIGRVFIRIPNVWTPNYLINVAQQLGPINTEKLKLQFRQLLGTGKEPANLDLSTKISKETFKERKFSISIRQVPSIVRYVPLLNTTEWFSTVLQSKITSVAGTKNVTSTNLLSINIQKTETTFCDMPTPQISIVHPRNQSSKVDSVEHTKMDFFVMNEDVDRNSTCDTTSIASDLTRMCVSDDDDEKTVSIYN